MSEPLQFRTHDIRDKKSGMKAAREKDLRRYLKHHNPNMAENTGETFRQEQIYKHLLEGVGFSASPEKDVCDNLMFTAPNKNKRPKKRGNKFIKEVYRTARFPSAVEVISKYDKDNRWACGVNANTLMTEYRRKVLFHALLDTGDVDEDRKDAQEKVKKYLQVNHPGELKEEDRLELEAQDQYALQNENSTCRDKDEHKERDALEKEMAAKGWQHTLRGRDNPAREEGIDVTSKQSREVLAEEFSITGKYANFIDGSTNRLKTGGIHDSTATSRPLSQTINDPEANFNPKFKDYDVMSNRWKYIRPELTSLLQRESMAPTSISRQVHSPVSGSIITGSFRDVIGFETNYERSLARIASCESIRESKSTNTLTAKYSMKSLNEPKPPHERTAQSRINTASTAGTADSPGSRGSNRSFVEEKIPSHPNPKPAPRLWSR